MAKNSNINISSETVVIAGGLAFAYFGIISPVLKKLGILMDANDKLVYDTVNSGNQNPFDPNFYKQKPGALILTIAVSDSLCSKIYNAFGGFNDDEETVIGIFRQLKTQSQVSFLSARFGQVYNQDLITFLQGGWWPQDRLSNEDLATVIKIVKAKPLFN